MIDSTDLLVTAGEASLSMVDVEMSTVGKKKAVMNSEVKAVMTDEDVENEKPPVGLFTLIVYCVTSFTVVVAIGAMAIENAALVYIAMSFPVMISPYASYQRYQIVMGDSLRTVINRIRMDVNRFTSENAKLKATNDRLSQEVGTLERVEANLNNIVEEQGTNASEFMNLMKENQTTLDTIKENLQGQVLQDLLRVVMQSDRDEDFQIDPEEINILVMRMQNVSGVVFNEDHFRALMKKRGYKLQVVMDICKTLIVGDHDDEEDEEHIFTLDVGGVKRKFEEEEQQQQQVDLDESTDKLSL
mmetsp:Transcript_19811/g.29168  ORF Transcript_19811/g.29168 Transcript_19811/m.29168 type:complete len:301 (-) Transcript_19811:321-1223(-)|eukprot:CAMPEP_0195521976 /NCGR_PEP_ID=MMETSP0794_2-20130614/19815_1 /TAXON_ID=515487 /ORGANISM="Stephanopyxis turris, Strain CCMP 815" /LENGTH=300 /DNA_ID=CAMNT_0040651645 /DNA_START=87 /DNA_END=989 /DNA_ORIENTATION=+